MLSRTASELYWLSRYLERAENMARMLEMTYSLALMPQDDSSRGLNELAAILNTTRTVEAYHAQHGSLQAEKILHFLALDEHHPASIYYCLKHARTNAHAVRGRLTADMWENLNAAWLGLDEIASEGLEAYGVSRFCEWVKVRSYLFQGATYGSLMRGDTYSFLQLGCHLERADNTLRLLVSRYELMYQTLHNTKASEHYQWGALLKTLSAFEAYTEVYRDIPATAQVAELLLLRADLPRSLSHCLGRVAHILAALPKQNGLLAQRMASEMVARVRYTHIDEVLADGLDQWLTEAIEHVNQLAQAIQHSYWEGV